MFRKKALQVAQLQITPSEMWPWAQWETTATESGGGGSQHPQPLPPPVLSWGPLSEHWPRRYIRQHSRLGKNTSSGPRSHIVMSGCRSAEFISPRLPSGLWHQVHGAAMLPASHTGSFCLGKSVRVPLATLLTTGT